jgi:hypothetical protein
MLSLELARKLKDAGLVWEPKRGDWFQDGKWEFLFLDAVKEETKENYKKNCTWLPSLSQLLAEIEERGYVYSHLMGPFLYGKYMVEIFKSNGKYLLMDVGGKFYGDTPEEAAGLALHWILRGGQDA